MDLKQRIEATAPWLNDRTASVDVPPPAKTDAGWLDDLVMLQSIDRVAKRSRDQLEQSDPEAFTRQQAAIETARGSVIFRHIHERLTTETRGVMSPVGIDRLAFEFYQAADQTARGSFGNLREAWNASGMQYAPDGRLAAATDAFKRVWNSSEGITGVIMAGVAFVADFLKPGLTRNAAEITANDFALRAMKNLERDGLQGRELVMVGHLIEKNALAQVGIQADSTAILDYATQNREARRTQQERAPLLPEIAPALPVIGTAVAAPSPPLPQVPSVRRSLADLPDPGNLGRSLLAVSVIGGSAPYADEAIRRQLLGKSRIDAVEKLSGRVIARLFIKGDNPVYDHIAALVRPHAKSDAEAAAFMRDARMVVSEQATAPYDNGELVLPYLPDGTLLPPIVLSRNEFADPSKWKPQHDASLKPLVGTLPVTARQMDPREVDWDQRFGGAYSWADAQGKTDGHQLRPDPATLLSYGQDMRARLAKGQAPEGFNAADLVGSDVKAMRERLSQREGVDLLAQLKAHNATSATPVAIPPELEQRLARKTGDGSTVSDVRIDEVRSYLEKIGNPPLDTPKTFDEARRNYTLAEVRARRAMLGDDAGTASGVFALLPTNVRAALAAADQKVFGASMDTTPTTPDPAMPAVTTGATSIASERAVLNDAIAQGEKGSRAAADTLTTVAIDSPERVRQIVAAAQESLDRLDQRYAPGPFPTPAPAPVPPKTVDPLIAKAKPAEPSWGTWLSGFMPFSSALASENVDPSAAKQPGATPAMNEAVARAASQ